MPVVIRTGHYSRRVVKFFGESSLGSLWSVPVRVQTESGRHVPKLPRIGAVISLLSRSRLSQLVRSENDFISDGGSFDLSDDDLTSLHSQTLNDLLSCVEGDDLSKSFIPVDVHEEEFRTLLSLSSGEERLDAYEAENLPSLLKSADYLDIQNDEVLELLVRKFLEKINNISWNNIGAHLVVLGNFFQSVVCSRFLLSALCGYVQPIELQILRGHTRSITSVSWSPDGTKVLTGSRDRTAKIWDAATGDFLKTLSGHTWRIMSVSWSPDGRFIVTGSDDRTAKIWDAATGECLKILRGHSDGIRSVSWSPDGSKVLTGSWDGTARIWNAATGECLQTLSGHTGWIMSVSWSPDGTKVLTGSFDNTARIWDAATGECLKILSGHTRWIISVSWSPDGSKVLTGSQDRTARIWNSATGECLKTLFGHRDYIMLVSWSPDGAKVLTGSQDSTAMIWDASMGNCLQTLSGHTDFIESVSWSPDGTKVLTGSSDRTARIWDLTGGLSFAMQQLFVIKAMQSGFDVRQYAEDSILKSLYRSLPIPMLKNFY